MMFHRRRALRHAAKPRPYGERRNRKDTRARGGGASSPVGRAARSWRGGRGAYRRNDVQPQGGGRDPERASRRRVEKLVPARRARSTRQVFADDRPSIGTAELTKRARKRWRAFHARFGTLHSFATGVVRSAMRVEIGLGPGFRALPRRPTRGRGWMDDAIARALERRLGTSSRPCVNPRRQAASIVSVYSLRRIRATRRMDDRRDLAIDETDAVAVEREMDRFIRHARAPWHGILERRRRRASFFMGGQAGRHITRIENETAALTGLAGAARRRRSWTTSPSSGAARRDERREGPPLRARSWRARGGSLPRAGRARHPRGSRGRHRHGEDTRSLLRRGAPAARMSFSVTVPTSPTKWPPVSTLSVDDVQDTLRACAGPFCSCLGSSACRRESCPTSTLRPAGLLVVGDRKQSILRLPRRRRWVCSPSSP